MTTTDIATDDLERVALARNIDEHPRLIGRQRAGDAALTAGETLIGHTGEALIGATPGDRLTRDVALAGKPLIGTTACHSALMFGRAVVAGEALIAMTVAGEALVRIVWIRDRRDPREV